MTYLHFLTFVLNRCSVQLLDHATIRLLQPDSLRSTKSNNSVVDDKYYTFNKVFGDQTTQEVPSSST